MLKAERESWSHTAPWPWVDLLAEGTHLVWRSAYLGEQKGIDVRDERSMGLLRRL